MSHMSPGQKILLAIAIVVSALWGIYQFSTLAEKKEELRSAFEHLLPQKEAEVQEPVEEEPPRLTVNPNYNGSNLEFIYSTDTDANEVARVYRKVTFHYYSDSGNAIRTVETWSYNDKGDVITSDYKRESCEMSDTTILQQEFDVTYVYSTDEISCTGELRTLTAEGWSSEPMTTRHVQRVPNP